MAAPRLKCARLGEKLLQIRTSLGLSQSEMLRLLGYEDAIFYTRISDYELNKRTPPFPLVLAYSRAAGVHMEDIVDDALDLPAKLPGGYQYRGTVASSRSSKK